MGAGKLVKGLDGALSRAYLDWVGERSALVCFLFHGLFENEKEMASGVLDPMQRTTVASFRRFVEYFLGHGYKFLGEDDLLADLPARGKYALITFDDGYYNNLRALPVLEEFSVPAIFYISANHVRDQKCFWWDAWQREVRARGGESAAAAAEGQSLKSRTNESIEAYLKERFGADCLRPKGDLDRPFRPAELAAFARSPWVRIGNHTCDHAVLTNYPALGVRDQIAGAQGMLRDMLGQAPRSIAYPNGNLNPQVLEIARECGLELGFSCRRRKIPLDFRRAAPAERMRLGRFMLQESGDVPFQLENFRSDISPYGWYKSLSTSGY